MEKYRTRIWFKVCALEKSKLPETSRPHSANSSPPMGIVITRRIKQKSRRIKNGILQKTGKEDKQRLLNQSINPLNSMGVRRLWDISSSSTVQYFKWDKTVVALPSSCSVWSRPAYSTWAPWFPHSRCPGTFSWDRSWSCRSPPSPACSPGGSAQTAASTERSSTAHLQKMFINSW